MFEKSFGWTGVLIEANSKLVAQIKSKNRKAHFLPAALCNTAGVDQVTFVMSGSAGKIGRWTTTVVFLMMRGG